MAKLSADILLALAMGSLGAANAQDLSGPDGSSTLINPANRPAE